MAWLHTRAGIIVITLHCGISPFRDCHVVSIGFSFPPERYNVVILWQIRSGPAGFGLHRPNIVGKSRTTHPQCAREGSDRWKHIAPQHYYDWSVMYSTCQISHTHTWSKYCNKQERYIVIIFLKHLSMRPSVRWLQESLLWSWHGSSMEEVLWYAGGAMSLIRYYGSMEEMMWYSVRHYGSMAPILWQ